MPGVQEEEYWNWVLKKRWKNNKKKYITPALVGGKRQSCRRREHTFLSTCEADLGAMIQVFVMNALIYPDLHSDLP